LIGATEMARAIAAVGGVERGSIVFFRTGFGTSRDAPEYARRPSLTAAAMHVLVEGGVKLVGTDLSGLEGPRTHGHLECHLALLENDIPFIENLANLDALASPHFFVCALPIPVRGLDSFPLRVIAFED
jgi:kynurenine formamidase